MPPSRNLRKALAAYHAGKLDEADALARDILKSAPKDAEAWSLLAAIADARGQTTTAFGILQRALALAPQSGELYHRLGLLYAKTGNLAQAEVNLRHALTLGENDKIAADLARLLTQSGVQRFRQGMRAEALAALRDAIDLGDTQAQIPFALCLSRLAFHEPRPDLKPLLARALREAWIMPADLARVCANLLRLEPAFAGVQRCVDTQPADGLLELPAMKTLANDALLLALLDSAIITDPLLEYALTAARRALLEAGSPAMHGYMEFAVALANQCFTNEYAFLETDAETGRISALERKLAGSDSIEAADLILLAAYRPVHRASWAAKLQEHSWPAQFQPFLARHIREPLEEIELEKSITRLTPIDDAISAAVREQYEENPFPRWVHVPVRDQGQSIDTWIRSQFPYLPPDNSTRIEKPEILVAGCGTGQEAAASARRFTNASVLAVDLSLRSLGYAMRKKKTLGLANVTYAQADILELKNISRAFDIVECAGVLHHLADPVAGWRVLADMTRPGGYMLLALYSERGRHDLKPVLAFIAGRGYGTSTAELRRFRAEILALPEDHPARRITLRRDDFYSLSMLRDLVFHVQEQCFTIGKIAAALEELGLEFCGFGLDPETRAQFRQKFGADADFRSLSAWDQFEEEFPDTFSAMYHFVVRKPHSTHSAL